MSVFALALTGCATPAVVAGGPDDAETSASTQASVPTETPVPTQSTSPVIASGSSDDAAREQAQTWLDAAALPPGAVTADAGVASFSSYQGWPCGPVAELEAFWLIADATVSDIANWMIENPTGDLISTAVGSVPDDPAVQSTIVGYIPVEGAQEGIVYTVEKTQKGVAVRAEIAAQTDSASCPVLPDGGLYGAPGRG